MREQRERLVEGVGDHEQRMDEDVRALEALRVQVRDADMHATELRAVVDTQDGVIRDARRALDAIRALAAELDVTRATAESDLVHLAQQTIDAVGVSLDEVRRTSSAWRPTARRTRRPGHPRRRSRRARRGRAGAGRGERRSAPRSG
jgi:hypothetical protein